MIYRVIKRIEIWEEKENTEYCGRIIKAYQEEIEETDNIDEAIFSFEFELEDMKEFNFRKEKDTEQ